MNCQSEGPAKLTSAEAVKAWNDRSKSVKFGFDELGDVVKSLKQEIAAGTSVVSYDLCYYHDWKELEFGGTIAEHDEGDRTGAILTTAMVVRGGNGKWTPSIHRFSKGRLKKRGPGRIAGKTVSYYYPGQVETRDEALKLCEIEWNNLKLSKVN